MINKLLIYMINKLLIYHINKAYFYMIVPSDERPLMALRTQSALKATCHIADIYLDVV